MASTFTNIMTFEKQGTLENLDTWGVPILNRVIDAIDETVGKATITVSNGGTPFTIVTASASDHRKKYVEVIGTLTSAAQLVLPAATDKNFFIRNSTTGNFAFSVTVDGGAGPSVTVAQGETAQLFSDSVGVYRAFTILEVADGGTGKSIAISAFNMMVADAGSVTSQTGDPGLIRTATTAEALTSIADTAMLTPSNFLGSRYTFNRVFAFTSTTTALVSLDPNVKGFYYWVQGAGGAGGAVSSPGGVGNHPVGGGGASGAFAHGYIDLSLGGFAIPTTLSIVVGEGGDPTTLAATSGEDGGKSEIVGYISCVGGKGAPNTQGAKSNYTLTALGASGATLPAYSASASVQALVFSHIPNRKGNFGIIGVVNGFRVGGGGQPGFFGWGAPSMATTVSTNGVDGRAGGGGSGAATLTATSAPGGRGGDGLVMIFTVVR